MWSDVVLLLTLLTFAFWLGMGVIRAAAVYTNDEPPESSGAWQRAFPYVRVLYWRTFRCKLLFPPPAPTAIDRSHKHSQKEVAPL